MEGALTQTENEETATPSVTDAIDPEGKETIGVNGQKLKMVIDTGSKRNLIGEELYNSVCT